MQTTLGDNFSFEHATIRVTPTGGKLRLPRKAKKQLKKVALDTYRRIATFNGLPIPRKAPTFHYKPE